MLFVAVFCFVISHHPIAACNSTFEKLEENNTVIANATGEGCNYAFNATPNRSYAITLASDDSVYLSVTYPDITPTGPAMSHTGLSVPLKGLPSINNDLRCPQCPECSSPRATLYILVPNFSEVTIRVYSDPDGKSFNLTYTSQIADLGDPSVAGKIYNVPCRALSYHYFDLDLDKPETVVITVANARVVDLHQQGILYIKHSRLKSAGDLPDFGTFDVSSRFTTLGRVSFSSAGAAAGLRMWPEATGKYLPPGRYFVGIGQDNWKGTYRRSVYPSMQDWSGCCEEDLLYTITIDHQQVGKTYVLPVLFPWLVFFVPTTLFLSGLWFWLRNRQLKEVIQTYKPEEIKTISAKMFNSIDESGYHRAESVELVEHPTHADDGSNTEKPVVVQLETADTSSNLSTQNLSQRTNGASKKKKKAERMVKFFDEDLDKYRGARAAAAGEFSRVMNFVAIFVFVPTFQFVFLQSLLNRSGADICHYNYKCKRDLWIYSYFEIEAFNNVYSNLCYILLGAAMYLYLHIHKRYSRSNIRDGVSYGIEPTYDLFYAVTIAIAWEGFGSGFFHMCPTFWNFQFDTLVMFFIASLMTAAIVTKRDPSTLYRPHTFFLVLAVVICLNFLGVYVTDERDAGGQSLMHLYIWVPIAITWLALCLFFTWRCLINDPLSGKEYQRSGLSLVFVQASRSAIRNWVRLPHFYLFIILATVQWIVLLFCVYNVVSTALFFLAHVGIDMIFALMFYFLRKVKKERVLGYVKVLFILFLVVAAVSLRLYMIDVATNKSSLDISRAKNRDCAFLFYDVHDIWHFTSSVGLCLFCLILYHVDDDLANTPTADIASTWVSTDEYPANVTWAINNQDMDHDPVEKPHDIEKDPPLTRTSDQGSSEGDSRAQADGASHIHSNQGSKGSTDLNTVSNDSLLLVKFSEPPFEDEKDPASGSRRTSPDL